ncbi:MAG TPA: class I SAM-dependent methyltransferase [Gaiellales bacterium]|jgi:SAM-dependent methyltransferase
MIEPSDRWDGGEEYEAYVGRWSRRVAELFLAWLALPSGRAWVDVGCGTGALTSAIVSLADPASVLAIDRSRELVENARHRLDDPRVTFALGDAAALPLADEHADAVVSGLVLNFLPDPLAALRELRRVARPGGVVAVYVWDYAEGMQPIRAFWDAAMELDPSAAALDEAVRFPRCDPRSLERQLGAAGMTDVSTRSIEIETRFRDFDDFWAPFLRGVGPAPGYCAALSDDRREALRALLRQRLCPSGTDPIVLQARAFAARGSAP